MRVLLIYLEPLDNEPLGLMYIGTVLEMAGHPVKIVGIERFNPQRRLTRELLHFKPNVVGLSITTPLANKAESIASFIKKNYPGITIIAGGPHPTILPYQTLKGGNIDLCVIGEGELTIIELLEALNSQAPLEEVKGIAFLKNGDLKITAARDYIPDLDTLPFVNRELLPKEVIYGRAGYPLGNPCMLLMTVRGCPYQCSFCQPTVDKIFGPKVRRRSVKNVISEIVQLKRRYKIGGLWIDDDTFMLDTHWSEEFCDLLIKENLSILWYINGRLNKIEQAILIKMREAGCVGVVLTPESGSQRIRNDILNKNISDTEIIRAYKICHEIGLPCQANIMLGSPTETEEDLRLSLALIKKIQPHFMNFSYTTALPATYLYSRYVQEINASPYYQSYENYDIGKFKKLGTDIPDEKLRSARDFFSKRYSNCSFGNRARHFLHYPYFRKIIYKRWKTLIFSRHPKFRHLVFDILAILIGSLIYFKNRNDYESDFKLAPIKN